MTYEEAVEAAKAKGYSSVTEYASYWQDSNHPDWIHMAFVYSPGFSAVLEATSFGYCGA